MSEQQGPPPVSASPSYAIQWDAETTTGQAILSAQHIINLREGLAPPQSNYYTLPSNNWIIEPQGNSFLGYILNSDGSRTNNIRVSSEFWEEIRSLRGSAFTTSMDNYYFANPSLHLPFANTEASPMPTSQAYITEETEFVNAGIGQTYPLIENVEYNPYSDRFTVITANGFEMHLTEMSPLEYRGYLNSRGITRDLSGAWGPQESGYEALQGPPPPLMVIEDEHIEFQEFSPEPKELEYEGIDTDILMYVHHLESMTKKPLGKSQYALFKGITDKSEVNKIFFPLESTKIQEDKTATADQVDFLSETLKKNLESSRRRLIKETEAQIKRNADRARDSFLQADSYLRTMRDFQKEIEVLEDKPLDVKDIVAKVLANPFWQLYEVNTSTSKITFLSGNVVLRYVNPKQGVEMQAMFGQFKAVWDIATAKLFCKPVSDKYTVDGNPHPHVSQYGDVCWGNAAGTLTSALRTYDIAAALNLLQSLLHTYNPDSPYVALETYFIRQRPELLSKEDAEYKLQDYAWIKQYKYDDYSPSPKIEDESNTDEDGEGDVLFKIAIYRLTNKKYNVPINNEYYYKTGNNRFFELTEGDIYEWC
jgi:hypothetical protein